MEEIIHGSSSLKCRKIANSFEYARKDVCVSAVKRLLDRARSGTLTREDVYDEIALVEASLLVVLPGEDEKLYMNNEHWNFSRDLLKLPKRKKRRIYIEENKVPYSKISTLIDTCPHPCFSSKDTESSFTVQ
uniref:Uncharacterized protein n=1 Tax=Talaromyces marneffei PM1 TaxID=1077442 RepID=A0A093XBG8_TALMA